jgi:quercetin dioxygenase-like cupin family protein
MGSALLSFDNRVAMSYWPRVFGYQGGTYTFHADSMDTGGKFALIEVNAVAGGEPPLHVHRNEDELFYVLEGQLRVRRGEEEFTVSKGESCFLPRNVPHTFKIVSGRAHVLLYLTPGGFEDYFRDLGQPVIEGQTSGGAKLSVAEMIRVAGMYGVTFMP